MFSQGNTALRTHSGSKALKSSSGLSEGGNSIPIRGCLEAIGRTSRQQRHADQLETAERRGGTGEAGWPKATAPAEWALSLRRCCSVVSMEGNAGVNATLRRGAGVERTARGQQAAETRYGSG